MNIDSIIWPTNGRTAINLYLNFLIKVIEILGLDFSSSDHSNPLAITKSYISGNLSEEKYRATANVWWGYLDDNNATRDLKNKDALMVRLSICLLSVTLDEVDELGEHLSWFFEVLEQLGINLNKPIAMMSEYFKFNS